jgi:hypothetical protein
MADRKLYRVGFLLALLLFAGMTVVDFTTRSEVTGLGDKVGTQVAPPSNNTTVITTHLQFEGRLLSIAPDGTLTYFNDTYDGYFDVDPSPVGTHTVLYVASNRLRGSDRCAATICREQVVERLNLSTGEVTRLHSEIGVPYSDAEWHDVDRVNDTHIAVADMQDDSVFIMDTRTGVKHYEWDVQSYLPLSTGNEYPGDWVHLNDVEVLDDGRLLASLRNQDQVVFLNQNGVIENMTLGSEGETSVLYEQHNPDYIPPERGGPALVVADSENNRVIEYQREGEEWVQSWVWQDARMQWPRDADRLPNGNTLITDSHADRVIEVNRSGGIVWKFPITAYEAERLETGDESAGGESAARLGLESVRPGSDTDDGGKQLGIAARLRRSITKPLPNKWINGIAAVSPSWMGFFGVFGLVFAVLTTIAWAGFEVWASGLRPRLPVYRKEDAGLHSSTDGGAESDGAGDGTVDED